VLLTLLIFSPKCCSLGCHQGFRASPGSAGQAGSQSNPTLRLLCPAASVTRLLPTFHIYCRESLWSGEVLSTVCSITVFANFATTLTKSLERKELNLWFHLLYSSSSLYTERMNLKHSLFICINPPVYCPTKHYFELFSSQNF
jgi:hypothetical protein